MPRHRASARAWGTPALARHRPYLALGVLAGAAALASGVMLILPGHASPPAAGGCGPVACAARRAPPPAPPRPPPPPLHPRGGSPVAAHARPRPAAPGAPP